MRDFHHCVLLAAVLGLAPLANAENLGTIGPTYPIVEKNLLEMIMARLRAKEASGELKRLQEQARERATAAVNNPRPVSYTHLDVYKRQPWAPHRQYRVLHWRYKA